MGSTYASVAIRKSKCRNRKTYRLATRRAEGIAWKLIRGRLGDSGARCDRRLVLFRGADNVVCCKLGFRIVHPRVSPLAVGYPPFEVVAILDFVLPK